MRRYLIAIALFSAAASLQASVGIDATASGDRSTSSTTITTSAFSTTSGNELLLAFVATDALSGANTTVQGIAGGGLTWVLAVRTNTQQGTSEIWRAFAPATLSSTTVTATLSRSVAASLTVMSFSGVDPTGTNGSGAIGATHSSSAASGVPTGTLTTTRNNSLVVGVGNDYSNAIGRTPGPGQVLVHQYLATIGDTYWVQRQSATTPLSGSSVTINDTAPTGDQYNLSICEILPATAGGQTWSISGTISPNGGGATLSLTGGATAQVTADSSGNYSFTGLANGSYTVTPSKPGFGFTPPSQLVTVNGANQPSINFSGQAIPTWSISGTISPAATGNGATVALSGTASATTIADSNGNYTFSGLNNGPYTVTPSKNGFTFTPSSQPVTIASANQVGVNFSGQASGIQLLQKGVNGNESTINSVSATFPSNNTAGNFLIVTGTAARPQATLTISDTAGNTYTPAIGPIVDSTQSVTAYIWYVPNCKGGANTVTLTPSTPGALEIHISEFSGIALNSPLDQVASAAGNGTSASSGAKVTTVNGELIFGYTFLLNTASAGAGFTGMSLVNGDLDEYEIQPAAGSVAATFTQTSGTWLSLMATFLPGGAAPPPTWSISGTISPTASGSGATVTLSGTATASVTADASGNYVFPNLINGPYTVTPSKSGFTFSPPNNPVTINSASQTGVNFSAQPANIWSISGTVSPTAGGAGATVSLSGQSSGSTVADANGNYTFTGLANGPYTVTPSKTGFTFTPPNQAVTVNGANQTGVNFTAQASSWSISGTIGGTGCSGCSFVQSTRSSQAGHIDWPTLLNVKAGHALVYIGEFTNWTPGSTVNMTDSHGNVWRRCDTNDTSDFLEVQDQTTNGMSCQYTVNIAAWPTITAQPVSSQCVNINCTQVGGAFFELALPATARVDAWATPHAGVSTAGSNNVSCGSITLTQPNDFLMCDFNNANGTPSAGTSPVSFSLRESVVTAIETGIYPGTGTITPTGTLNTSGIGYTSITVAFTSGAGGAGGGGATVGLSGASTATTVADANGNYSFTGLANGTYTVAPSATGFSFIPSSQPVIINNSNQVGINFAAQPINITWSISGTISPTAGGSGATVSLSGQSSANTVTDANGNYSFTGLANGAYIVTPSKTGFTFTPGNQAVTVNGANQTAVNFTAQAVPTWTISGTITPTTGGVGATVALSGAASGTVIADGSGNYAFPNLANGAYTVTPSNAGFTFTPVNKLVTISGASQTGVNFTAQPAGSVWSISGTISPAAGGNGSTVTLSGAGTGSTVADANGNYTLAQVANGSYTVTPTKGGYTFNPTSLPANVSGANVTGVNFTAVAPSNSITQDVNVSKDGASASTTITSPALSTTAGNELLLAFIATDYISGTNTTVKSVSGAGLTWVLAVRSNGQSGSSEIWRAFSASPLSGATVTATLSQSVVSTITVLSFSGVDPSGTNGSGAVGATAMANAVSGAPTATLVATRANSLVFGVGNDFDNAVTRSAGAGQSLLHQFLTSTGDTYWVQKQNNPTSAAGTSVTINDTAPTKDRYNLSIIEVLPGSGGVDTNPPTVSMTAPAQGATIAGSNTVSAMASDDTSVAGVQFLLDGAVLGAEVTTPPYSIIWDTTKTTDGAHTLTARARDGVGLTTTSSPVNVTVDNSGNFSVVGSWSSVVSLPAVAVNLILLQNNKVLFYQDGSTPTVWDYTKNTFLNVPAPADLFCSGHALLADGRVLVVGGYGESGTSIGIADAEIFDPANNTWTSVPKMSYKRWYPTATTLPDGRILVTAGWQTDAHSNAGISEIYNPATNSWTQLTNANNPFETYPFLYVTADGRVIHIGGSEYATDTDILNLSTVNWSVIDSNIVDGGSATMYLPGKFMKAGSAADSQNVGPSSNTTFVLDTTQASPAWHQTPSMANSRSFLNLTTLPDGTVLATGGETDKNGGKIANAVYAAELWSPQTQTWSLMASMHTPREYHGTALLLPDARVLVSGMGADFGNVPDEKSAEFYSPPYLFKGPRPTVTQSPAQAGYGSNFFVATPDGASISSVSLIRTGAVTHFFDQNARYVPLTFQQTTGGLTVTAPANANLAPPGFYMLFIVNSAGVPSVAPFIQLQ